MFDPTLSFSQRERVAGCASRHKAPFCSAFPQSAWDLAPLRDAPKANRDCIDENVSRQLGKVTGKNRSAGSLP
jgi:hypothetical protein